MLSTNTPRHLQPKTSEHHQQLSDQDTVTPGTSRQTATPFQRAAADQQTCQHNGTVTRRLASKKIHKTDVGQVDTTIRNRIRRQSNQKRQNAAVETIQKTAKTQRTSTRLTKTKARRRMIYSRRLWAYIASKVYGAYEGLYIL